MGKQKIEKVVFRLKTDNRVRWSDVKHFQFEDDDVIEAEYDGDAECYWVEIRREVEETNEEYRDRLKLKEIRAEINKKRRFEDYLKLKKEFEDE